MRKIALDTPNVTVLKPKMRFDEVVREYGWCFPSKDVANAIYYARKGSAWAISDFQGLNRDGTPSWYRKSRYAKWNYLVDSPFVISDKCCNVMKEAPIKQYERKSGKHSIFGTTAAESHRRLNAWYQTGCNNFDSNRPVSKP